MSSKTNNEIVITALTDCLAVRSRPGIYVGSISNPDLIFREVIDGSFDESYANSGCNQILISTNFNGYYFCADNGRGIPISMSESPGFEGKTQTVLALSKLHAGSHFKTTDTIKIGMHGVGESCTNFLSEEFVVLSKITENNYNKSIPDVEKLWTSSKQRGELFYVAAFRKGELIYETALKKRDIEKTIFAPQFPGGYSELPGGMSTMVFFRPDPEIFDSVVASIPIQNIQNFLLIQDKFYGKKVTVNIDGTEYKSSGFKPYQFEFTKTITPKDHSMNPDISVYVTFETDPGLGNKTLSGSVNGLVVNQGIHLTWLESLYSQAICSEFKIKHKCITNGLRMHVLMIANEVLYDSQTKSRLRSISKVKQDDLQDIIKEFIKVFRKNPDYWNLHVDKLNSLANSMKSLSAMEKAQQIIDDASGRGIYKAKGDMINGFSDATAGACDRWNCEAFIVEGLSPAGSLKAGRKSTKYTCVIPLKGKVKNVKDSSADQMMDNKELFTIFKLVGLGIDANNVTKGCSTAEEAFAKIKQYSRYGKLVIATDADEDGLAIQNGLLYAISKFARFMLDFGLVYIAESPIFEQGGKYFYPSDPRIPGTQFCVGMNPSKHYRRFKG